MGDLFINPVQFVAFILAAAISAVVLLHQFLGRIRKHGWKSITMAPVFVGGLIAVGALGSLIHNKSGENMPWLYSSEAIDSGLFEWLTVACLIAIFVFSIRLLLRTRGLQRLMFMGLAIASFVVAGEEMSWGQWIFYWDTPESMAAINLQNETNLHNLVNPRIYDLIYYMIGYATLVLALFAYFMYTGNPDLDRSPQKSFVQIMTSAGDWLRQSRIGLVVTVLAATLFTHELFEEYAEFVLAFGLALFVFYHFKHSQPVESSA